MRPSAARGATRRSPAPRSASSPSAAAGHSWDPRDAAARALEPVQHAHPPGREHPRLPAVELDRVRRVGLRAGRGPAGRAALFRQAAAGGEARRAPGSWSMTSACRSNPGETPEMRMVRFRTLGCYPLSGAVESRADDAGGHHRRDARRPHQRAPGPPDRQRRGGLDGEEEARGLFLMDTTAHAARAAEAQAHGLLRFLTCGSVDDGKSTLIGRLLYDSQLIFEDTLAAIDEGQPQARHDRRGHRPRPAGRRARGRAPAGHHHRRRLPLLRHAAPRPSSSPTRRATSSTRATWRPARRTPTLAIILIDARKGVLTQTRRHCYICSLLGIRDIVVAVNKIDLVGFNQDVFDRIVGDYLTFAARARLPLHRADPDLARASATTSPRGPATCPGTAARRWSSTSRPWMSRTTWRTSPSASRCSG